MWEFIDRNWIMIISWFNWRFKNPCDKGCVVSAICSRTGKSACPEKIEHDKHAMYYYAMRHTLSKQICRDWGVRNVSERIEMLYLVLCYFCLSFGFIGAIALTWGIVVIIIRMWS